ncbi:erythrocyte adducin alpha subunit domain protein [Rickettsia felis str. Pedreira]|uniref:Erythrocyte adducin alpha subunit domain protein n=1 Tax=Rickettsia felis str. Pedreira TaxID=1359196 RepID=A0A0F3MPM1_RICFI|nr:erythrocyte adducin alpha subunit domain protein [Rickettsia felis str. Pedreira]
MDIKYNLAAAYRIMAYLSLDDHTIYRQDLKMPIFTIFILLD